jgi:hypothetical protein
VQVEMAFATLDMLLSRRAIRGDCAVARLRADVDAPAGHCELRGPRDPRTEGAMAERS